MVKKLIDEIKEKLEKFKTVDEKLKYLNEILKETDNEELKEVIRELIKDLEKEDLEERIEETPVETKREIPKERPTPTLEEKHLESRPRDDIQEQRISTSREKKGPEYVANEPPHYVLVENPRTQSPSQSALVQKLQMDLERKHLMPTRGLIPTTQMKQRMRNEITKYFGNTLSEERIDNYLELFTTGSFKKYKSNSKEKEEDSIDYHLIET